VRRRPATGQLAALLPAGTIRCGQRVDRLNGNVLHTGGAELSGRAIVVAAGPVASAELVGTELGGTRALTTYYHLAPESPAKRTVLHLDGDPSAPC
jgi:hypothetical protein